MGWGETFSGERVIEVKYDSMEGGWVSREVDGAYGCTLSKSIRKGFGDFVNFTQFDIGDGTKVRFCRDKWRGDLILKDCYPSLFNIAVDKEAKVRDYGYWERGRMIWDPHLRRHLRD
uniref:Uncharacterized protein n=1 Tax=Davidia involucrata TaxID=16924 RepID=A0A5B7AF43_DAVIN